jgi:hypothetical protein
MDQMFRLSRCCGSSSVWAAAPLKHFLKIESDCREESSVMAPDKYRASLRKFLGGIR